MRPAAPHSLRRWVTLSAAFVAVMVSSGGCSSTSSGDVTTHEDGSGPLSAQTGSGGTSIKAPEEPTWSGTFGSALLCTTTGKPITLKSVSYQVKVTPLELTPVIRTGDEATDDEGTPGPIISMLGTPDRPNAPEDRLVGRFTETIEGLQVRQDCEQDDNSFTELLTVMKVGPDGGSLDRTNIRYRSDGKDYQLRVDWELAACGDKVAREWCDGQPD